MLSESAFYFTTPANHGRTNRTVYLELVGWSRGTRIPQSMHDDCFRFDPISSGDEDDDVDARGQGEQARSGSCICTLHKRLIRSLVTSHVSDDGTTRESTHSLCARNALARDRPLSPRQEGPFPSPLPACSKCSRANIMCTMDWFSTHSSTMDT